MQDMLNERVKITQVVDATAGAAGATDIESDSVDMNGYEGVMFVAVMGAITAGAVTSMEAHQSGDDFSADDEALAGTKIAIAADDDGQVFVLDVLRPLDRYVKLHIDRATQNAVVQTVLAIQYDPRDKPIANAVADALTIEGHYAPEEGTA